MINDFQFKIKYLILRLNFLPIKQIMIFGKAVFARTVFRGLSIFPLLTLDDVGGHEGGGVVVALEVARGEVTLDL